MEHYGQNDDGYKQYIASSTWKRRRQRAISTAGERCQRCGMSSYSVTLEVHHKTYERLGDELDSDLEVLCPECHGIADQERQLEMEITKEDRLEDSKLRFGFYGWMDRSNDSDWKTEKSDQAIVRDARTFLDQIGLDSKNPNFIQAACGIDGITKDRAGQILLSQLELERRLINTYRPSELDRAYAQLDRIVGMRELQTRLDCPLMPDEASGVVRTARHFGIAYTRMRFDLNGINAGKWTTIETWIPNQK